MCMSQGISLFGTVHAGGVGKLDNILFAQHKVEGCLVFACFRHLRGFIRWMRENNVEYSEALAFHVGNTVADVGVKSQTDLHEGDVIATIPKQACLTVLTSEAREIIAEAEFGGGLGLAIALMYERSLGVLSKWYGYLQLLPSQQCLPFVWTLSEIDRLLVGTELHKVGGPVLFVLPLSLSPSLS